MSDITHENAAARIQGVHNIGDQRACERTVSSARG